MHRNIMEMASLPGWLRLPYILSWYVHIIYTYYKIEQRILLTLYITKSEAMSLRPGDSHSIGNVFFKN